MDTYFMLMGAGGYPAPDGFLQGTISYAGGSTPLLGNKIGISHIVETLAATTDRELVCDNCVLTFSTGPFVGLVRQDGRPDGYSFSGGGSLQIIGGASARDGSWALPADTVLLTGVPTKAFTVIENGPLPVLPEVIIQFQQGELHPGLRAHFDFPAGAFTGEALIASADTTSLDSPPQPFVISRFVSTHFFEPSYVLAMTDGTMPTPFQKS